jgi:hypothetical protein
VIVDPQPGPTVRLLHLHSEPRLFVGVDIPLGDAYRPELLKAEALHRFTHLRFPPYTKRNDGEVFVYPLYPIGDARSELEMSGWSVVSEDHSVDVMEKNWLVVHDLSSSWANAFSTVGNCIFSNPSRSRVKGVKFRCTYLLWTDDAVCPVNISATS